MTDALADLARAQEFVPVVLGGDRLGYSLARGFHMAYGYRTVVVSTITGGPIAHSGLIEHVPLSRLEDPAQLVPALRALADRLPSDKRLLLATTDHLVTVLARVKDQLSDLYLIPYPDAPLIERLTHKENFAQLCAQLDIPHPRTMVFDLAAPEESSLDDLSFPVIAKPSNAEAWAGVSFEGKQKVHAPASRAELDSLIGKLTAAGYTDKLIVQDVIPGDDQGMRILTCYVDQGGTVRFACFGQVLLEEHTPDTWGFPAAIMTSSDPVAVEQATRLLEHVGWRGWANFDLKFDPRTGQTVFFELNPRLGGTSFYITAAGHNVTTWYVDEYVRGESLADRGVEVTDNEHVFTAIPMWWLKRYVTDPATAAKLRSLAKAGEVTNPWFYSPERNPRRWAWIAMNQANYVKKYRQYYPEPKALV